MVDVAQAEDEWDWNTLLFTTPPALTLPFWPAPRAALVALGVECVLALDGGRRTGGAGNRPACGPGKAPDMLPRPGRCCGPLAPASPGSLALGERRGSAAQRGVLGASVPRLWENEDRSDGDLTRMYSCLRRDRREVMLAQRPHGATEVMLLHSFVVGFASDLSAVLCCGFHPSDDAAQHASRVHNVVHKRG